MTPHDFYDGNRLFIVVNRSICCNFADNRSNVFSGTSISGSVVSFYEIVINCLRNTDKTDLAICSGSIAGKLAYGIHRIISANVEEISDVFFFESAEQFRINRIS